MILNLTKNEFKYLDFSVEIFNSLESANHEGQWSSFDSDFLTGAYLNLLEKAKPSDISFRYLVIRNSGRKVCGILYFQVLRFSGKNFNLQKWSLLKFPLSLLLKACDFRLLICGNVFAVNFKPYTFDPEKISENEVSSIANEFTKIEKCDAVLLKDFGTSGTDETLHRLGYQNYMADLTMCMELENTWKSLEDYKSDLSKKYRKRFEKITSSGSKLVRRELTLDEIISSSDSIFDLYKQVTSKQTITMGLIPKNYFEEFKTKFPDRFKLIGYYLDSKLVAFCTYIDRHELLEVHYIGMDYQVNETHSLYFNILFDSLEVAILSNKSLLELGRTAREAKANLGCTAVYFNDYMKLKSKLAIKAANWFGRNFEQSMGEDWKKRNPFKK